MKLETKSQRLNSSSATKTNVKWEKGQSTHSEKILKYYSSICDCLVAQNTVAKIWSNAWSFYSHISHHTR